MQATKQKPGIAEWDRDQLDRKARAEAGETVVANMRKGADEALMAWAETVGLFVRIDRRTEWGNPWQIGVHGDRPTVIERFRAETLPGLGPWLPTLRGRVLGCWCHPESCHGHLIAEVVNRA
jgi:hypothetical protein